jgi:hypothetical protein
MAVETQIETDNAAFEEAPSCEVARILRKLADVLERDVPLTRSGMFGTPMRLMDVNGNHVGFCKYK